MTHGDGSTRIESIGAFYREIARLDLLASTGPEVFAAYLLDRCKLGTPGASGDCPLWHELAYELSYYLVTEWTNLSVGQCTISVTFRAEEGRVADRLYIDTPRSLRDFACRFDKGEFPALIKPTAVSLVKV